MISKQEMRAERQKRIAKKVAALAIAGTIVVSGLAIPGIGQGIGSAEASAKVDGQELTWLTSKMATELRVEQADVQAVYETSITNAPYEVLFGSVGGVFNSTWQDEHGHAWSDDVVQDAFEAGWANVLYELDCQYEDTLQTWIDGLYDDGDITAGEMNDFVEWYHERPTPELTPLQLDAAGKDDASGIMQEAQAMVELNFASVADRNTFEEWLKERPEDMPYNPGA